MWSRSTKQRRSKTRRNRLYRLAAQPVVSDHDLARARIPSWKARHVLAVRHVLDPIMCEWAPRPVAVWIRAQNAVYRSIDLGGE